MGTADRRNPPVTLLSHYRRCLGLTISFWKNRNGDFFVRFVISLCEIPWRFLLAGTGSVIPACKNSSVKGCLNVQKISYLLTMQRSTLTQNWRLRSLVSLFVVSTVRRAVAGQAALDSSRAIFHHVLSMSSLVLTGAQTSWSGETFQSTFSMTALSEGLSASFVETTLLGKVLRIIKEYAPRKVCIAKTSVEHAWCVVFCHSTVSQIAPSVLSHASTATRNFYMIQSRTTSTSVLVILCHAPTNVECQT